MIHHHLDMKQFFEQCLRDLEALTGKQQLRYWEIEAGKDDKAKKEGERKIQVCVAGMMEVSKKFPEILDHDQQGWIQRMIVEDAANYEQLNSATIWKWLNMKRMQMAPRISEDEMKQDHEPATDEQVKKYVEEFYRMNAGVGRKVPDMTPEEIAYEGQIRDPLLRDAKKLFPSMPVRPKFRINGHVELYATNSEVAKETYKAEFPGEEILEIEEIKQNQINQ